MSCKCDNSNDFGATGFMFGIFIAIALSHGEAKAAFSGFVKVIALCTIIPIALFFLLMAWRLLGAIIIGIRDGIVGTWDLIFSPKIPSPMTIEDRQKVYGRGLTQ